jgi:hypothetical protein
MNAPHKLNGAGVPVVPPADLELETAERYRLAREEARFILWAKGAITWREADLPGDPPDECLPEEPLYVVVGPVEALSCYLGEYGAAALRYGTIIQELAELTADEFRTLACDLMDGCDGLAWPDDEIKNLILIREAAHG